ncbi:MAG: DUF3320 domain-containing protein [Chlorobiaceae bacterium]|nr:DUF3320 domain-containing protein [Chlorobiaceae bacterium]
MPNRFRAWQHVIEQEGPIQEEVLVRRIDRFHGFKRTGKQIQEIVLAIAKNRKCHIRYGSVSSSGPERSLKPVKPQHA